MKYKIRAFFEGRNGMDQLSNAIMWVAVGLLLVSMFISMDWLRSILYYLSWAGLFYAYYRAFSRKLSKRQAENARYLGWKCQLKQRWQQRKTHKFYRCPKCRTMLRVPKGKGKISITCRSCAEKFIRKT